MYGDPVASQLNPDGTPNLLVRGVLLHSTRAPRREADRIAAEIVRNAQECDRLLVLGVGCGYAVEALDRAAPELASARVKFFEPFARARGLGRQASGGELGNPAHILNSVEELTDFLRLGPRVFVLPQWRRLLPDIAGRLQERVADPHAATRSHFFRGWSRNFFHWVRGDGAARFLANRKGQVCESVVYCGAGPTLLRDLLALGEVLYREGTLVVAADTAIAPLILMGCEPDVVASIDSGRGTAFHFLALRGIRALPLNIPILTWSAGSPALPQWTNDPFYFRSSLPYEQFLGEGPLGAVPEYRNLSGNAAGLAVILADAAGATEVHMAGALLQMADGQTHVRGTGYDLFAALRACRVRPVESYRNRGYESAVAPFHARAREALAQSATAAGTRLMWPTTSEKDRPSTGSGRLPKRKARPLHLPIASVPLRELREFLWNNRGRMPLEQLPDGGRVARRFFEAPGP